MFGQSGAEGARFGGRRQEPQQRERSAKRATAAGVASAGLAAASPAISDEHVSEIEPGLFLGSRFVVENWSGFERRLPRFTHILTADMHPLPPSLTAVWFGEHVKLMFVDALDIPAEDLLSRFDDTFDFIAEAQGQPGGACFVHCVVGVSRSATIVAAYLMRKYGISYLEAMERIVSRRRMASPNSGFRLQLKLYERMQWTLDRSNVQYKLYLLATLRIKLRRGFATRAVQDYMKKRWHPSSDHGDDKEIQNELATPVDTFRCKKCRLVLFDANSVLPHLEAVDLTDFVDQWNYIFDLAATHRVCTRSTFIEPQPWMKPELLGSEEGQLACPKCGSKFGSFQRDGIPCECGTKVCPGLFVVASKVDKIPGAAQRHTSPLEQNGK